jgi:riboflavin synthase
VFTGLVEEVGRVADIRPAEGGARIALRAGPVREGLAIGDSVSVNGACLTAVALEPDGFAVDAVAETLRRTALGGLAAGDPVNLERALRLGDRLGGHLVQGHVDATGTVASARDDGESTVLEIAAPPEVLRYVVEKGSVAVDGVSLTVAARSPGGFAVALIPHTMAATTLGPGAVGRPVNLEVDLVAKYVEALVAPHVDQGGT